jgi:hypothetical protein
MRDGLVMRPIFLAGEDDGEEFEGTAVAVGEGGAELAGDEEAVGEGSEGAVGQGVLDLVAEEGAGGVGAGLGVEVVAAAPGGEGAAELDVAEAILPDELGDLGLPWDAEGEYGKGRKLKVTRVPGPAAMDLRRRAGAGATGRGGGEAKAASSMRAFCPEGMRRGRSSGLAKKAKTSSMGSGSHCSAWKVWGRSN